MNQGIGIVTIFKAGICAVKCANQLTINGHAKGIVSVVQGTAIGRQLVFARRLILVDHNGEAPIVDVAKTQHCSVRDGA